MAARATVDGVTYQAEISAGGKVEVYRLERGTRYWTGDGRWSGTRIEDCAADLPAGVYEALDAALAEEVES